MITMKLHGMKELLEQLAELRGILRARRTLIKAAKLAVLPVLEAAKQRAPVDYGVLRDSLKLTIKNPPDGEPRIVVGIRIGKAAKAKPGVFDGLRGNARKRARRLRAKMSAHWRWHFVEFGTSRTAAKPFIRPAFDQNVDKMLASLRAELARELEKALRRKVTGRRRAT